MKVKMLIAIAAVGWMATSIVFAAPAVQLVEDTSSNMMTQAPNNTDNTAIDMSSNTKQNNGIMNSDKDELSANGNDEMAPTADAATGDDY